MFLNSLCVLVVTCFNKMPSQLWSISCCFVAYLKARGLRTLVTVVALSDPGKKNKAVINGKEEDSEWVVLGAHTSHSKMTGDLEITQTLLHSKFNIK